MAGDRIVAKSGRLQTDPHTPEPITPPDLPPLPPPPGGRILIRPREPVTISMAAAQETDDLVGKAADYLKRPYARIVVPEADGSYRGEILEFPGCIATGDTPAEALESVEDAANGWLQAALARHQPIPDPVEETEFSGKLVLRMPRSLHKKAARLAEHDGVSLNQFIVTSLAEHIGEQGKRHPMRND